MADTYAFFELSGFPRSDLLRYVVENIRRFKPLVAVGHDINGEYQHSMHMVYTDLLMEALTISNDASYDPDSAQKYGLWDVPKTYLHLYEENPIIMDWDQPLDSFDGMTAFEVTQKIGFPCHVSQISEFAFYLSYYPTAAAIPEDNPCYFGLYRTTVGEDVEKNDFFENIITYGEQERMAEAERLEQERLTAEAEAQRIAEEKRQAEAQRLAEEAAQKAAEEARLAQEAQLAAEARQTHLCIAAVGTFVGIAALLLVLRLLQKAKTS